LGGYNLRSARERTQLEGGWKQRQTSRKNEKDRMQEKRKERSKEDLKI
jgi:hypothetical protein